MLIKNNEKLINEKAFAEEKWLMYFNDYLLENGVINKSEHNKMIPKIMSRTPCSCNYQYGN